MGRLRTSDPSAALRSPWRSISVLAGLLLPLLFPPEAESFDGVRKGFVLGFGLGPAAHVEGDDSDNGGGVETDFKIGVGLSRRLQIHYTGRTLLGEPGAFLYPSVGGTYYLQPGPPSLFVSAGAGVTTRFEIESTGAWQGITYHVGGGYEFAKHFLAELSVIQAFGTPASPHLDIALTVSVLGY